MDDKITNSNDAFLFGLSSTKLILYLPALYEGQV